MRLRRRHRRWIAIIALLGLLFQQFAMASYLCPIESRLTGKMGVTAEMPPCHAGVTTDQARCHQHCSPLPPSPDHPPMPTVPALLPVSAWQAVTLLNFAGGCFDNESVAVRAAAPPLTVQHCTFQI